MRARGSKIWALLGLSAAACQAAPEGSGLGRVSVALTTDVCSAYCLSALRVELYEYDKDGNARLAGTPLQPDCGDAAVVFDGLGAGRRVYVAVRGYDITSTELLAGQSADITVVADASQSATVQLAAVDPPTIALVAPDPIAATGGDLTLSGTNFASPLGEAGLTLGALTLSTSSWTPTQIVAAVPAGASGSSVRVTRCGIASQPYPLRLVGASLGVDRIPQAPGCTGRAVTAVAADADGDLVSAFACDTAQSYLQRFTVYAGSGLCPAAPERAWELPAAPVALAMAGATAWVALARASDNIVSLALDEDADAVATVRATVGGTIGGLAATTDGGGVWAIADGKVVRVDGGSAVAVDGIDAAWTATGIVGVAGRAYAIATTADGQGRLAAIPATAAAVTSYSLSDCPAPVALDALAGGTRVVVACGGSSPRRVIAFVPADGTHDTVDLAGGGGVLTAVAFDGTDTAALARLSDGRASLVRFGADAGEVGSWPTTLGGAGPLARVSAANLFVAPEGGELDIVAPYDPNGSCAP